MLTDMQIKKAKPAEKARKLYDGNGLYLLIEPTGGKLWRMRYKLGGKERKLSFGSYPLIGLTEAREARDEARRALAKGVDPSVEKRTRKASVGASDTQFETIARRWYEQAKHSWSSPKHQGDVIGSLERHVFPTLGRVSIDEINAPTLLRVLRSVEKTNAIETAHRVRQRVEAIYAYAIPEGLAEINPAAMLTKAMTPVRKGRQPAIVDLVGVRELLQKAEAQPGGPVVKLAHRLLALTATRIGELRTTPWAEFNEIDEAEPTWRIAAERRKGTFETKADHAIPLSWQALDVIKCLREVTGKAEVPFPNPRWGKRNRFMSDGAINSLLNGAGYRGRHVPHGWRSAFSSVMNERRPGDRAVIDLMLSHVPKDRVESAYNRALYMPLRRVIAQEWADILLEGFRPAASFLR